jgi:hypothetical protein
MDLGEVKQLKGVVTQGRNAVWQHVYTYRVKVRNRNPKPQIETRNMATRNLAKSKPETWQPEVENPGTTPRPCCHSLYTYRVKVLGMLTPIHSITPNSPD